MTENTDAKLGTLRYKTDKEPHILVNNEIWLQEGELHFQYEDCIECGTCKIICPKGAVEWNYPRGTFGVTFRYG